MRVLNLAEVNHVTSGPPDEGNTDANMAISASVRGIKQLRISKPRLCNYSDLENIVDEIEITYRSMNQISKSLEAILQNTRYAVMSDDCLLHQKVAQVYQDLGKAGNQMQQLKSSTARFKEFQKRITTAASNGDTRNSKFRDLGSKWNSSDESDSAVIEVFFDCFSRFYSRDTNTSIDELWEIFIGSPEYRFELLPSFYPKQYISEGSISEEVFAVAMLPSSVGQHTFRYFLNYAETARRWQRIVVSATFHGERKQTDSLQVAASGDYHTWGAPKALPPAVHRLLRTMLPFIESFPSTTQISLDLKVGESGQITAESSRIEVIEEKSEISQPAETEFLQFVDGLTCKWYVESDVVTYSRINSTSYRVYVDSQKYVENKVVFASGRKQGNNAFLDYLDEIKHCISLSGCANVSGFRGIILDDTKRHLRGYLKDLPRVGSLEALLALTASRSNYIPRLIRELWARQLIEAMVEIHSQGLIAGVFGLDCVGIRTDGRAVLHKLQRSENYLQDRNGRMPPELQNRHPDDYSSTSVRESLNFYTDVFQLGVILWLLMEHVPNGTGVFCAKSDCTHFSRRTCTKSHSNPVELPKNSDDVPAYLCDIVRDRRLPDPRSRITASELARVLKSTPQPEVDVA